MRGTAVLAVAAALTLTGCSIPGPGGEADGGGTTGSTGGAAQDGASEVAAEPSPGAAVEDLPVLTTRNWQDDNDKVRIDLNELRVRGDYVRLVMTLTNEGDEGYFQVADLFSDNLGGITLQDTVNSKRYLAATTKDDSCVCTRDTAGLFVDPGLGLVVYTTFQAPPADVRKIDVELPGVGVVDDVPVQR